MPGYSDSLLGKGTLGEQNCGHTGGSKVKAVLASMLQCNYRNGRSLATGDRNRLQYPQGWLFCGSYARRDKGLGSPHAYPLVEVERPEPRAHPR